MSTAALAPASTAPRTTSRTTPLSLVAPGTPGGAPASPAQALPADLVGAPADPAPTAHPAPQGAAGALTQTPTPHPAPSTVPSTAALPSASTAASASPAPDQLSADHLPTITLAELNAAAGLLTRVDRKYLVPLPVAQDLLEAMSGRARVLQIDGLRRFRYASTYFDTPALDSYYLAARGRRRRFKVRTRTYLDSDLCFLEVKTQGSRETTVKERLGYRSRDASRITSAGRDYVAACLNEAGIGELEHTWHTAARLRPVLDSTYERTTLHLPTEDARLTIDTSLAWTARGERTAGHTVRVEGLAVVETKTSAASSPADRLLWARGYRPVGISKYATAMAALHPGLPSNKWHRTLTRDLAGATTMLAVPAAA